MNNYSNNKSHDPNRFREVVKVKYNIVKVVVGKLQNLTRAMIDFFGAVVPAQDLAYYCQPTPAEQLPWEEKGNDLTKPILS